MSVYKITFPEVAGPPAAGAFYALGGVGDIKAHLSQEGKGVSMLNFDLRKNDDIDTRNIELFIDVLRVAGIDHDVFLWEIDPIGRDSATQQCFRLAQTGEQPEALWQPGEIAVANYGWHQRIRLQLVSGRVDDLEKNLEAWMSEDGIINDAEYWSLSSWFLSENERFRHLPPLRDVYRFRYNVSHQDIFSLIEATIVNHKARINNFLDDRP